MVNEPLISPWAAAAATFARSAACRHNRACFTNASPAGVTPTLRLVRANSVTPSSLSSDLI